MDVNFSASKEQSVADFGGSNRGSGQDTHAPTGASGSVTWRELIQFDMDWPAEAYQHVRSELELTMTSAIHLAQGGSARAIGRRILDAWQEDGGGENSWSSSANTHWGNQPSTTATGKAEASISSTAEGKVFKLDVSDIVEALMPARILRRDGTAGGGNTNRGLRVASSDEGSASRSFEFYSRRGPSGKRPRIKSTFVTNHPPAAPTITSAVGSSTPAIIGTATGTEDTTAFLFVDADAGDTCARVQVQYYGAGATDAAPGTLVKDSGAVAPTGAGSLDAFTVKVTGLPARTQMRKRLRTQDDVGAWGAWTSLADGFVQTAYKPRKPASPLMQSTPDRPHIFGTIDSGDTGDYVTGWEGELYRDDPTGTVTLRANGREDIGGSPTRSDIDTGLTLATGDIVRWRHRHYNRDGVDGDWSEFYTTPMVAQTGPTTMTPSDTGTKLLSRTAALVIGNASSFDGIQWRLYRSGVLLYDSGLTFVASTTSTSVNLPSSGGVPLCQWGDQLEWEAAIRPTGGSLEAFSPKRPIYIDSLPITTVTVSA